MYVSVQVAGYGKNIYMTYDGMQCSFYNICWKTARQSMLDAYPSLQNMYSADDGNTEVFYLKNVTATFSSFTHEPEVVKF